VRAGRWTWPAVFAACVIGAGIRSLTLGQDGNWDLKNYHWYNAWALLNGRMGWDLAPAQIQTYYNPVGDLPFYFLVQALPGPKMVAFAMALSTAVAAYYLIRLCTTLFAPSPLGEGRGGGAFPVIAATAIGVTGAAGQATIGSTMNEWLSAAFLLPALHLATRNLAQGVGRRSPDFGLAAFLVGCSVGLKLTYGVFAVGFLAALVAAGPWREGLRRAGWAAAFALAGFLLFGGYWAWTMAREFGNPTFPYYNHVFGSPWWEPVAFFDRNWGPREPLHWLLFPLYFARQSALVSEVGFRDYRLATLLILALLAAVAWALRRDRLPPPWRFLAVFTLVSYAVWIKLFGIYRYLVPLELLSGPLIVGCLLYLARPARLRYAAIVVLAILLVGTTRPMNWGRIPFGERFLDVRVPELPPNSLVIMGFSHPLAYNIPFFRPDARFVSPASNFLMPGQRNLLARRIEDVIRAHTGPIYLMEYRARVGQDPATLAYFGLAFADEPCRPIRSPLSDNYVQVCAVARRPPG
jgi:hypothetical protein